MLPRVNNSQTFMLYFWAVILSLIGIFIVVAYFREKRRREALEQAALELGFSYQKEGDPFAVSTSERIDLLGRGHSRKFSNLLRGSGAGAEMLVFDYKYTTGSGKNQSTRHQTVAAFRAHDDLPSFTLTRETFLHKLISAFGYQDIDLEAHPQFSARYLLRGKEEAAVRAFFHPGLVAFFESPEAHDYIVEGGGGWLLLYQDGRRSDASKLREFIEARTQYASGLLAQMGRRMRAGF